MDMDKQTNKFKQTNKNKQTNKDEPQFLVVDEDKFPKTGITEYVHKPFVRAEDQDWQRPLLFDWEGKNGPQFTEKELYDSEISRILRNEFYPPWANPDDPETWNDPPDDYPPRTEPKLKRYPRLSSLTKQQHQRGLKFLNIICGDRSHPTPTPQSVQFFEEIKELYEDEQKDYLAWAKKCWVEGDCIRKLNPIDVVETVYEAQFKLKRNIIQTVLYNEFTRAGYISLRRGMDAYQLKYIQDLKSVDVKVLPNIRYPDEYEQSYRGMDAYGVPKPCPQHPCNFKLPHENEVTSLSLHEIHLELARFAMANGAEFIASESALQCLVDTERRWKLPMSVAEVVSPDGGGLRTVVVVGSEFSLHKESGAQRTHDAFRHLLRYIFTTATESSEESEKKEEEGDEEKTPINVNEQRLRSPKTSGVSFHQSKSKAPSESDDSSCSSEQNLLVIDEEVSVPVKQEYNKTEAKKKYAKYFGSDSDEESASDAGPEVEAAVTHKEQKQNKFIEGISCTCAMNEEPFPRSFKKWQLKSAASGQSHNIIIHASHKTRDGQKEVILEPIVEWQPELGGCKQSAGRLWALTLALMMRPNAELVNVRMDYGKGDVITTDKLDEEQMIRVHGDKRTEIADTIREAMAQLLLLKPGQYILAHDTDIGMNAIVCAPEAVVGGASSGYTFSLRPKSDDLAHEELATLAQIPPALGPALMPYHVEEGILPLAFTPDKRRVEGFKKKQKANRGKKKGSAGSQASRANERNQAASTSGYGKKKNYVHEQ